MRMPCPQLSSVPMSVSILLGGLVVTLTRLFVQANEEHGVHAAQRRQRRRDARVAERVQLPVLPDDIPKGLGQPLHQVERKSVSHIMQCGMTVSQQSGLRAICFTCAQGSSGQ
jgi:hypothetical protein